MARLFLRVGRFDGVRPADLVGAIANEANLPGDAIGDIDIYDAFSFVEVPEEDVDAVRTALNRTTIRGKPPKATLARPEEELHEGGGDLGGEERRGGGYQPFAGAPRGRGERGRPSYGRPDSVRGEYGRGGEPRRGHRFDVDDERRPLRGPVTSRHLPPRKPAGRGVPGRPAPRGGR